MEDVPGDFNLRFSSIISKDATSSYQGCYQDGSPSNMTFIGGSPPVQINASIVNGNFSQPVMANNTFQYITSTSTVPNWDFNAALANNSDAWGFTQPYPMGPQCASIQMTQYITQHINFSTGT